MRRYQDNEDGTMSIYEDGYFIERIPQPPSMAERHTRWHETTTKSEALGFYCKNRFDDNYLLVQFEEDLQEVGKFSGGFSIEDIAWIEKSRRALASRERVI